MNAVNQFDNYTAMLKRYLRPVHPRPTDAAMVKVLVARASAAAETIQDLKCLQLIRAGQFA